MNLDTNAEIPQSIRQTTILMNDDTAMMLLLLRHCIS